MVCYTHTHSLSLCVCVIIALLSHDLYTNVSEPISPARKRNIILVSKIIQNLSNQLEFGNKEAFMHPVNERFIRRHLGTMRKLLADLAYVCLIPLLVVRVSCD
jgi:hypothetical protein